MSATTFVSIEEAPGPPGLGPDPDDSAAAKEFRDASLQRDTAAGLACRDRWKLLLSHVRPWLISPTPGNMPQQITRAVFIVALVGAVVTAFVYGFPQMFDPWSDAMKRHVSPAWTIVSMFAGIVVCPFFLLPKEQFEWILALGFPLWEAALVTQIATTLGAALQFYVSRRLLQQPLMRLIGNHKVTQGIVLAAQRAGTFRVTALVRIGPAPWGVENYALAYPESMTFLPYIAATFIFRIPANILECYFGANLNTISNILTGQPVPAAQVVYQLGGLFISATVVIVGVVYARRAMKHIEDEQQGLQIIIITDPLLVGPDGVTPRVNSLLQLERSISGASWGGSRHPSLKERAVSRHPSMKEGSGDSVSGMPGKLFLPLHKLHELLSGPVSGRADKGQLSAKFLCSDSEGTSMAGSECSGAMSSLAGFSDSQPFSNTETPYSHRALLQQPQNQQQKQQQQTQMQMQQLTACSLPPQDLRTESIMRGTRPLLSSTSQNLGRDSTASLSSQRLSSHSMQQDLQTNSITFGTRPLLSSPTHPGVLVMSEDMEWREDLDAEHSPSYVSSRLSSPGCVSPRGFGAGRQRKVSRHSIGDCDRYSPPAADVNSCNTNWGQSDLNRRAIGTHASPRGCGEMDMMSSEFKQCASNRSSCSEASHPIYDTSKPHASMTFASAGGSYGILNPPVDASPRGMHRDEVPQLQLPSLQTGAAFASPGRGHGLLSPTIGISARHILIETPHLSSPISKSKLRELSQLSAASLNTTNSNALQPPPNSQRLAIVHQPPRMKF